MGAYTTGKCCLYVKRLSDVNLPKLKKLIRESVKLVDKWQGGVPPPQQAAAKKKLRGSSKR